jgi:hypothetical protein
MPPIAPEWVLTDEMKSEIVRKSRQLCPDPTKSEVTSKGALRKVALRVRLSKEARYGDLCHGAVAFREYLVDQHSLPRDEAYWFMLQRYLPLQAGEICRCGLAGEDHFARGCKPIPGEGTSGKARAKKARPEPPKVASGELFKAGDFPAETIPERERYRWVGQRLCVDTKPEEAPDATAWAMLQYYRLPQNQGEFWAVHGALVKSKEQADSADPFSDDGRDVFAVLDMQSEPWKDMPCLRCGEPCPICAAKKATPVGRPVAT